MYPQLIAASQRLAPVLARLAARGGSFATPFWKASQIDAPDVPVSGRGPAPAPTGPQVPISGISPGFEDHPIAAPAAPVPQGPQQMPWWMNGPSPVASHGFAPQPAPQAQPAAQTAAPQSAPMAPMPQARPTDAPQAQPDTSFFMRNALMQRDPVTGQMLDPSGASSVSGPDLISKMMTYLHGKASA
jgi:hypothetical protein